LQYLQIKPSKYYPEGHPEDCSTHVYPSAVK